jgi:hypothetical protein
LYSISREGLKGTTHLLSNLPIIPCPINQIRIFTHLRCITEFLWEPKMTLPILHTCAFVIQYTTRSMHHMLAYKIMQHLVFILIRDLSRNIFVKLMRRSQLIPIGHYQQEMLMRKATFLKLCNICICQHLTKVFCPNQVVMKIMELGSVNPYN